MPTLWYAFRQEYYWRKIIHWSWKKKTKVKSHRTRWKIKEYNFSSVWVFMKWSNKKFTSDSSCCKNSVKCKTWNNHNCVMFQSSTVGAILQSSKTILYQCVKYDFYELCSIIMAHKERGEYFSLRLSKKGPTIWICTNKEMIFRLTSAVLRIFFISLWGNVSVSLFRMYDTSLRVGFGIRHLYCIPHSLSLSLTVPYWCIGSIFSWEMRKIRVYWFVIFRMVNNA